LKRYETVFITNPDLSDSDAEALAQRFTDLIQKGKGEVIEVQQWGKKKLAYPVDKQTRGYYTLLDYASPPHVIPELERVLRLDDAVLKYLTIMTDDSVDVAKIREALEDRKARAAQTEERPEEAVETPPAAELPEQQEAEGPAAQTPVGEEKEQQAD
jgi:small subunit ribosomal protein S6